MQAPIQGLNVLAPLARLEITTARLRLVAGDLGIAAAVYEFHRRNRRHFAPWDPPTAESFYTLEAQTLRVQQGPQTVAEAASTSSASARASAPNA